MKVIEYSKELKIINVAQLPKGLNAPYLECVHGLNGELIAKQWRRTIPANFEILVKF